MKAKASFIRGLMNEELPYGHACSSPEACKAHKAGRAVKALKVSGTEASCQPLTARDVGHRSSSCSTPERHLLDAPDVALLGNAGLAAYLTWPPTLTYLSSIKVRWRTQAYGLTRCA
jgi:hypothetical protein